MPFDGTQLSNSVAADLLRARAYLVEHGWHQGSYGYDGGPHCLLGAIHRAIDDECHDWRFTDACRALGPFVDQDVIHVWNDVPGRTFDQVLAALDHAIASAMAETA
jgi:hypothetical protein